MTTRLVGTDTLRGLYIRADEQGTLVFVASTAGVKRDGLELDLNGLKTENYLANPVFLWAHDYGGANLPIGRCVGLEKTGDRLTAKIRFDLDDKFAAEVYRKYRDGYLNAVSIGWDPDEWDDCNITSSDLLDISAVPVPGDPDALIARAEAWARSFRADSPDEGVSGEDEPRKEPDHDEVMAAMDKARAAMSELRDLLTKSENPEDEDPDNESEADADDEFGRGLVELLTNR